MYWMNLEWTKKKNKFVVLPDDDENIIMLLDFWNVFLLKNYFSWILLKYFIKKNQECKFYYTK